MLTCHGDCEWKPKLEFFNVLWGNSPTKNLKIKMFLQHWENRKHLWTCKDTLVVAKIKQIFCGGEVITYRSGRNKIQTKTKTRCKGSKKELVCEVLCCTCIWEELISKCSHGDHVINLPFLVYFQLIGNLNYGLCEQYISAGRSKTVTEGIK